MKVERHTARVWDKAKGDFVNVTVQVEVDFQRLAQEYAANAVGNKSRAVKQCRGAVKVVAK